MVYIFFGSGDFAAGLLVALAERGILPEMVISTPDKPRGRGLKIRPGPVAEASKRLGIPLLQPAKLSSPDFIASLPRADFILLSDFGRILKKPILEFPKIASLNLHPSLLPLWRGAAPIERSLMAGGPYGITLFAMDEGTDTGPVVLQEELPAASVSPYPTKGELVKEYLRRAPELIKAGFEGLIKGSLRPVPQEGEPTYAPRIEKSELWPDWEKEAEAVARHINALSPKPGARVLFGGKLLKLLRAVPVPEPKDQPGKVIIGDEWLAIACSDGAVRIEELQPEGRRPMSAREFTLGLRL